MTAAAFASCTSFAWAEGAADPPPRGTELHWVRGTGADQCISAAELRTKVAARLGQDPFSATPGQWLEGFVERQGQVWSARIFERGAKGDLLGSRLLHNEAVGCRELDQALVLTIALLIAPDSAGADAPPESPPPVPPRALDLAAEHRRLHPNGQLGADREVIAVDALVRLGRREEARRRARPLIAAAPTGIYARRLRRLLGDSAQP